MNKSYLRLFLCSFIFILITGLNILFNFFNIYTIILFLLLYLIFIYYFIGYEKSNHRYQKDIIINILIYSIIYYIITYLLGVFIGFNKTGYSLTFLDIMKHTLPILLMIPIAEIIRYILVTKGTVYKSILAFVVIGFVMLDMTLLASNYSNDIIKFIIEVVMPSLAKNILLVYLTLKLGYKPGIIYRFIFELPVFILPIFPDFGLYITSLLSFLFPISLAYYVYSSLNKTKNITTTAKKEKHPINKIMLMFLGFILIVVVALTTGYLKYFTITIGSNSMVPNINKGDVLIVEKLKDEETNKLKVKDILVFNHDGIIIVHRIVKILDINGDKYFYTKGDNNNSEDGYPIKKENVIGTTVLRIPYAGYFTVQVYEKTIKK